MPEIRPEDRAKTLGDQIGQKETRKLRARRRGDRSVWFGLGMFGVIGWSVTIPALIGLAVGLWIDANWPGPFSWTLMLLLGGLILGCLSAWYWLSFERRLMDDEAQDEEQDHAD